MPQPRERQNQNPLRRQARQARHDFYRGPFRLRSLHAHALRFADRALQLADSASEWRGERLQALPDCTRPTHCGGLIQGSRLRHGNPRQVASGLSSIRIQSQERSFRSLREKGARLSEPPFLTVPSTRGFDYFHGIHHAGHMDTIIENDKVIERLDEIHNLPRLTEKSIAYIEERSKSPDQPFFLYVPLGSPHTPIVPTKEWQGKSGLNPYADFVMQTDATVGAIADALEKNGFADNTLLIFTSDNGCSKQANIGLLRKKGHHVSAHYRGSKADIWDGGHRVPFVVRWPGKVEPGSRCDQLITLVDFFATASEITGEKAPSSAEDSVSFLPALFGKSIVSTRKGVIHHSVSGHFAYRQGKWKLLLARGSGGWSSPKET